MKAKKEQREMIVQLTFRRRPLRVHSVWKGRCLLRSLQTYTELPFYDWPANRSFPIEPTRLQRDPTGGAGRELRAEEKFRSRFIDLM